MKTVLSRKRTHNMRTRPKQKQNSLIRLMPYLTPVRTEPIATKVIVHIYDQNMIFCTERNIRVDKVKSFINL